MIAHDNIYFEVTFKKLNVYPRLLTGFRFVVHHIIAEEPVYEVNVRIVRLPFKRGYALAVGEGYHIAFAVFLAFVNHGVAMALNGAVHGLILREYALNGHVLRAAPERPDSHCVFVHFNHLVVLTVIQALARCGGRDCPALELVTVLLFCLYGHGGQVPAHVGQVVLAGNGALLAFAVIQRYGRALGVQSEQRRKAQRI